MPSRPAAIVERRATAPESLRPDRASGRKGQAPLVAARAESIPIRGGHWRRFGTTVADGMACALLVALGTGLCLDHGRVGFMPLDQSIVFDGAWRLLCGQRPFRDFVVPSGLVPMVMQAAFFKA